MWRFNSIKTLFLLIVVLTVLCCILTMKYSFINLNSYMILPKSCNRALVSFFGLKSATSHGDAKEHKPMMETMTYPNQKPKAPPKPIFTCDVNTAHQSLFTPNDHNSFASLQIGRSVLVITDSKSQTVSSQITSFLESARFEFKVTETSGTLQLLTDNDRGRYSVIIFVSLKAYVNMDYKNRKIIDKYCRDYSVGMIIFVHSVNKSGVIKEEVQGLQLAVHYNIEITDYRLNDQTDLWRITRPGKLNGDHYKEKWTMFEYNHSAYEPLAYANTPNKTFGNINLVPLLKDKGFDGIRRIYFGNDMRFWLHQLVLLDALSYLSHGKLSLSLDRYIQVDIDDIFYAKTGLKMTDSDAEALAEAQDRFREYVEDFTFYLGFSGSFYQTGNAMEKAGDENLIEYKDKFLWFGHTWSHTHAHELSQDQLEQSMRLNYQFAKEHRIPIKYQYSIAPWHDGVFPVHDPLYEAWKNVWGINVTSTEEYPQIYPTRKKRGFIHKGIMVLPRQVCGVWTFTVFLDKYPGGKSKLDNRIKGGELFRTILTNPIDIFMTHIQNYANDRLALYTFEGVFNFIKCWTNLKLKQISPNEAAIKYFDMFPEDKDPLWLNPCLYKRHFKMWAASKNCKRLPKLLLIGPKETGTKALYTLLDMHPAVSSNYTGPLTNDEVQFFNGDNYNKGLDWYLNIFPNTTSDLVFEKSDAYFDDEITPKRAHALLPEAKIICVLIDPAKRYESDKDFKRKEKKNKSTLKDRLNPPIEEKAAMEHLSTFYRHYNAQLYKFLKEHMIQ